MSRVWDTSKTPPKPFVTLCQIKVIQGQEVEKVEFKILCLGGVIHVLGQDFRHEHFLNDPNRITIENRNNAKIPVNS